MPKNNNYKTKLQLFEHVQMYLIKTCEGKYSIQKCDKNKNQLYFKHYYSLK